MLREWPHALIAALRNRDVAGYDYRFRLDLVGAISRDAEARQHAWQEERDDRVNLTRRRMGPSAAAGAAVGLTGCYFFTRYGLPDPDLLAYGLAMPLVGGLGAAAAATSIRALMRRGNREDAYRQARSWAHAVAEVTLNLEVPEQSIEKLHQALREMNRERMKAPPQPADSVEKLVWNIDLLIGMAQPIIQLTGWTGATELQRAASAVETSLLSLQARITSDGYAADSLALQEDVARLVGALVDMTAETDPDIARAVTERLEAEPSVTEIVLSILESEPVSRRAEEAEAADADRPAESGHAIGAVPPAASESKDDVVRYRGMSGA